jgi:uncharacterized membrane protein
MQKTLLGVFTEQSDVEEAVDKLKANGLNVKDFSIVMKNRREAEDLGEDTGADVASSALAGATTGAAVGGLAGLLVGTVLPGLGGFLIGGPIGAALGLSGAAATTVSGAATGALAGGLIGALMGLGLSREDAQHYESRVQEGAILLIVPTDEEKLGFVRNVFNEYNASDVKTIMQDSSDESHTISRSSSRDDHSHAHQQYATMGAKGGKSSSGKSTSSQRHSSKNSSHEGKGWHGDSAGHAKAGRGQRTKK